MWVEIGKIIWYSFRNDYAPPRRYYFVAPKGVGTSLTALLADANRLRAELLANWEKHVRKAITSTQEVPLDDALLAYVNCFDFSIFNAKTGLQLVEDHYVSCPFHSSRFGGGLKPRPEAGKPPVTIATEESRYVTHLLEAYAEHIGKPVADVTALSGTRLKDHFQRQREAFYHAEALRLFARDSVPSGIFESLQDDIYDGVVDTHDAEHADGYMRVCAVTKAARELQITANALISCTRPTGTVLKGDD